MVCFTQHTFKFTNTTKQNWFNVLCKYYNGVEITMKIDGKGITGRISHDFFSGVPTGENYELSTERFWAERASIQVIPKYVKPSVVGEATEKVLNIANSIDNLMLKRAGLGGCEVYISSGFENDNFDQIVQSIAYLKIDAITRMYIGTDYVLFVLNDRHAMIVSNGSVSDGSVPIFDLDDGFIPNIFGRAKDIADDWNVNFNKWKNTFLETNGDNWNEPVIQ